MARWVESGEIHDEPDRRRDVRHAAREAVGGPGVLPQCLLKLDLGGSPPAERELSASRLELQRATKKEAVLLSGWRATQSSFAVQSSSVVRGIIFDLDGTLVDSGLDFDEMRREMRLPAGQPLLEALAGLPEPRALECREILARHEWAGALRARLMPGVPEFLAELSRRHIRRAVLTRNCREVALATLGRLQLQFDVVVTREDAPAKPDPTAIWMVCEKWGLPLREVVMLGDFVFDIEAGRRAGVRTVLYTAGREPRQVASHDRADFCLRSFAEAGELLGWLWLAAHRVADASQPRDKSGESPR